MSTRPGAGAGSGSGVGSTAAIASLFVREDEVLDESIERTFEQAVLAELAELRREVAELRDGGHGPAPGA